MLLQHKTWLGTASQEIGPLPNGILDLRLNKPRPNSNVQHTATENERFELPSPTTDFACAHRDRVTDTKCFPKESWVVKNSVKKGKKEDAAKRSEWQRKIHLTARERQRNETSAHRWICALVLARPTGLSFLPA